MRDYRYLEHMGMGVPRKIIAGMRAHNGTEPVLVILLINDLRRIAPLSLHSNVH